MCLCLCLCCVCVFVFVFVAPGAFEGEEASGYVSDVLGKVH